MATRLYFHQTSSSVSNLPTTEQSTLTADSGKNADAFTVNRSMNTTLGTAQTSLSLTTVSTTSLQTFYYTRFVSEQLSGVSSISANTWTYNAAYSNTQSNSRFPVLSAQPLKNVVIYVWRPSTQTKVGGGNIFDGASPAITRSAGTSELSLSTTVSGAAVSGIVDGDVIVCEIWVSWT